MTVRAITTDERYGVYVDFTDGASAAFVCSYSDPNTAEKCRATLTANVPASYIARAWIVDREIGAEVLDIKTGTIENYHE